MATRIDINEVFDQEGNLISSETVTIDIPELDTTTENIVSALSTLTSEQRTAIIAALQA